MSRLFTVVFAGAMVFQAIAHNSKIATYTLRHVPEAGWYIEMNFAAAGVQQAMISEYGEAEVMAMTKEEFRDAFVEYARANFQLVADDGVKISLESGGVKLGSHQTDMKFVLPAMPDSPEYLEVQLTMFASSSHHTNLFRVYKDDILTKFILTEENGYKTTIAFTERGIMEAAPNTSKRAMIIGIGTLVILLSLMAFQFVRTTKLSSASQS